MTTPYHIKIAPAALRQIKALPSKYQKTVVLLLEGLSINPRPPAAHRIEGMTGLYREEVEQLRLIYKVEEQEVLLLVVRH